MNKIQKIKGFLWIRYEVFDNENLNGSDIMVYATLMRYMNNETKECFPSIKNLAKKSRLTQKTIYESLNRLEKEELIYRKRGRGRVNHYIILEPLSSVNFTTSNEGEMPNTQKERCQTPKRRDAKHPKGENEQYLLDNTKLNNTNLTIPSITIVFEYWNSFNIIIHKQLTDKIKRAINGRLKEKWTVEEISQSIKNYATILKSPEYYWTYKWTLVDFLSRGIDKFKDWDVASNNYRKDKDVNLLRVAEGPK